MKIRATDEAKPDLDELKAKLDELRDRVATARAEVDSAGADEQLADLDAKLEAVSKKVARPTIDMAGASRAAAQVTAVEADLDELDAKAEESAGIQEESAERSESAWAGAGEGLKLALLGVGAAAVYGVYKAAGFQQAMELLHTQAGISTASMKQMSAGVLQLAGQVGQGPDSLAEAAYHVASNMASMGASVPKMLGAVKVAAEGARVGNANLVDVTNALGAAIASGIPGVQNYQAAMGALNATVGAGDMTMQDLADAMGTGMLAVVKGYGLSLNDVGAALATFGDNNIRGARAAQQLREVVENMAKPVPSATAQLKALGMTSSTLADDMRKGGLKEALADLEGRFRKYGVSAKDMSSVLTNIVGKQGGSGLDVLMSQMDRLNSKYPELSKGAKGFGAAWAATQQTTQQKLADLEAGSEALATKLGTALLPAANKIISGMTRFVNALERGNGWALTLAGTVGSVLALMALKKLEDGLKGAVEGVEGLVKGARSAIGVAQKLAGALTGSGKAAQDAAAVQTAASGEAAAAAEADAGEVAAANDEAAAESSGSWLAAAASTVAGWATAAAGMVAQAAVWVAANTAKVAVVVAENVAGAAVTAAAWVAANAVMLLGIGLVIAAVALAVYEIVRHWKSIVHGVEEAWDAVYDAVKDAVGKVIGFVKSHWELLLAILLGPIAVAVLEIAKHWDQIVSGVERLYHDVSEWVSRLSGDVLHWFESMWDSAVGAFSRGVSAVLGWVRRLFDEFIGMEESGIDNIVHWFEGLPGRVMSAVGSLPGKLFSFGSHIISMLASGIESAIGSVTSAIGSVAGEILDHIPHSPAKKGPLSGSGSPDVGGRKIAQMLAQGIVGGLGDVTHAMDRIGGAVAPHGGYGGWGAGAGAGAGAGGAQRLEITLKVDASDSEFMRALMKQTRVLGGDPGMFQRKVAYR